MNEREALMKQIMAYSFAAHEWNLYLDTHPNDRMALGLFKSMRDKAEELKQEYIENFGPISVTDVNGDCWSWICDPWPWN